MRNSLRVLLLAIACGTPLSSHAASAAEAEGAFAQLSALVGDWSGKTPEGREHRVNLRTTAGGTVLVETWTLGAGRESMTLYHLDGDALAAVHYCPQATQPRLKLTHAAAGRWQFEADGGSSLGVPGRSHQHAFSIAIEDAEHFSRSESYVENGSSTAQLAAVNAEPPIRYTRIPSPKRHTDD